MRTSLAIFLCLCAYSLLAQLQSVPTAPRLISPENIGTSVITSAIKVSEVRSALKQAVVADDIKSVSSSDRARFDLKVDDLDLTFEAVENTTMSPAFKLAAPDVRSYTIACGSIRGRLTTGTGGLHAYLFTKEGIVSIAPLHDGSGNHRIDYGVVEEHGAHDHAMCGNHDHKVDPLPKIDANLKAAMADVSNGGILREYRLAIVSTGEFWDANGASTTPVRATIVSTVDAMNEIFMTDVSFRFTLNTPQIWNDPATDPFIPDNAGGAGRPDQAGIAVNDAFNVNSYDVGHVFHKHTSGDDWSSGGVAQLRAVCNDQVFNSGAIAKARGWSGSFNNTTVGWIQLAAHEFGHMFNCPHTFNGSGSSCDAAISQSTAYEIASGTTIMSYNGICGTGQNIANGGDADSYFHSNSLLRMVAFINDQGDCAQQTMVDNVPPEIDADPCGHNGAFMIPRQTPFILSGEGSDADGDIITYVWEQYNEDGDNSTSTQGFIGLQAGSSDRAPLFRSFPPSVGGNVRYFPSRDIVMDGVLDDFEVLPRRARTLNFQLVARDNNPNGGGLALQEIEVPVSNQGPLLVTSPSANTTLNSGETIDVIWTTGGSDDLCAQVDILLSADNGQTFQYLLASGINYSAGAASVTIPGSAVNTEEAKVMVRCSDSECVQFYNVTAGTFDIVSTCLATTPRVCPTDAVSFNQGDPGLDLDLSVILGSEETMMARTLTDTDGGFLFPALTDGGACETGFAARFSIVPFAVDVSGSYRFPLDNWQDVGVSIHTVDNWDPANPCASIVGSSYRRGTGFSVQSSLSGDLEACVQYYFVVSGAIGDSGGFSEIALAPGPVVISPEIDPDYTSTFVAVDEATGIVTTVSATADFTVTPAGEYQVYAINYKSGGSVPPTIVDPSTWVGQTLDDVIAADNCFAASGVTKPLEIISTCQILGLEPGLQTVCDPSTGLFNQDFTITYDLPPSGDIEFGNGQTFPVTGSPQEVTLTGLVANGEPGAIEVFFVENPGCRLELADAYVAPENCCPLSLDLPEAINACRDSMINLDAGGDGATYMWSVDGVPVVETTSTLPADADGNYAVTVTTATGCAKEDAVDVMFFDNPQAQLLVDDTVACEGDQILLTLDTDGTDISWTRDGTPIAGGQQIEATVAGLYRADISNVAGCITTVEQQLMFNTTPDAELGDNQEVCAGTSVTLDAATAAASYQWSRDGSLLPAETNATLEVTQSGRYSVVADGGGGCTDEDFVEIEFFDLPEITIGGDTAICEGTPITLVTNPQNVTDFTFSRNGTALTIPDLANIIIAQGGDYVLAVRNEIDCEVVEDLVVVENDLPIVDLAPSVLGCEGSEVLLASPTMGAEYRWELNGVEVGNTVMISVDQPGTYDLFVKDDFGCEGTDAIVVTFEPGPSLSIDGEMDVCSGDVVMLTAATTGDNVQWSRDGQDIAGATDFVLQVTESGIYRATVEAASGCIVEDQVEITVFDLPTVTATPAVTLCDGASQDLTVVTTGNIQQYSWTRDGMPISGDETVSLGVAGSYQVVVTDDNGCSGTAAVTVINSSLPLLTASSTVLDICDGIGEEVTLTTDAATISWSRDGQLIAGATGTSLTLDQEGTYQVVALSADGCESSLSIEVNARQSPIVDLGGDLDLCPGESETLSANAAAGSTIEWSDGSSGAELVISNDDVTEITEQIITLTVTNEFNCTNTDEITVTLRPVVMAAIDGPMGVCEDGSAELVASGGLDYVWTDPSGTLSSTDGATVVATPTETTTYTVQVTDNCGGAGDEAMITLVIFEPSDDVSAGMDTAVVIGQSITLNATGGVSYQWADDPTITMGGNTAMPTVSPSEPTTYTVLITDSNGCTYEDTLMVSINDDPLAAFQAINLITPNDDGDNDALVFVGLEAFPDNTLQIYNRWGALLFEANGYQTIGSLWDGTRNGEPLPADTYFYVLQLDGRTIKSALTILRD